MEFVSKLSKSQKLSGNLLGVPQEMTKSFKSVLLNPESCSSMSVNNTIRTIMGYIRIQKLSKFEIIDMQRDNHSFSPFLNAFLRVFQAIRHSCKFIINHSLFETFIIFVILANSIVLALEGSVETEILDSFEVIFLYIYTAECGLKIIGLGFIQGENSFLKDKWNLLDLVIVISGWVEHLAKEGLNLSALRALRILRPLRGISSIAGLKIIFSVIIKSIKPLLSTLLILTFFCFFFATAALQIWMRVLKFRCMEINSGEYQDICGYYECTERAECVEGLDNPNLGTTNFDNILYAMLAVFQIVTLEGWMEILVMMEKAVSPWVILYFVPLVFLGSFCLINLTLAVIKLKVTDTIKEESMHEKDKKLRRKREETQLMEENYYKVNTFSNSYEIFDKIESETESLESLESFKIKTEKKDPGIERYLEISSSRKIGMMGIAELSRNELRCDIEMLDFASPSNSLPINRASHVLMSEEETENHQFLKFAENVHESYDPDTENEAIVQITRSPEYLSVLCTKKSIQTKILQLDPKFKFKFELIEDTEISMTSKDDIIGTPLFKYEKKSNHYFFTYIEPDCEPYINFEEVFNEFKLLIKRSSYSSSYKKVMELAEEIVKEQQIKDKNTLYIESETSCFQIDPFDEEIDLNEYFFFQYGFSGYIQRFREKLEEYTESKYFVNFVLLCVILNIFILAMDHHGIEPEMSEFLDVTNLIFTSIFALETVLKLVALGVKRYSRDLMNCFDGIIVLLSIVEFSSFEDGSISAFRTIRIFRIFRVMRIARIFTQLREMETLLGVVAKSFSISLYLALLLLVFTIIFTLLGMSLFRGEFDFPEGKPRANFDDFHKGFITTFEILSVENWNSILYNAMRTNVGAPSALFFIVWILIGNFVLLNLFLAILLDSFGNSKSRESDNMTLSDLKEETMKKRAVELLEKIDKENSLDSFASYRTRISTVEDELNQYPCKKSYCIFGKRNSFRKFCTKIIKHPKFEGVILILIVLSSAKLVLDTYWINLDFESTEQQVSSILDLVFTLLFTVEFGLKSISTGFIAEKKTYLRNNWNELDFCIIILSWVDFFIQTDNIESIKVIRLLRTLRPLRFISHNLSMKIVVNALIESIKAIINVVVLVFMVWLIFAIVGVSFFSGKLYECENPDLKTIEDCLESGFEWVNSDTNFDNVLEAMMALFITSSLEGWPDIMYSIVDATEVGKAPQKDANPAAAYYLIIFIVVGSFFFLELFIGIVFEKFEKARNNESELAGLFLTQEQERWVEILKLIPLSKPYRGLLVVPTNKIRLLCYHIAKSSKFEFLIFGCIALNMLEMALIYAEASEEYIFVLETTNLILSSVFVLEACIKITGLGLYVYFCDRWNKFDFIVVLSSVFEIIFHYSGGEGLEILRVGPQLARVLRITRVAKLLRLIRSLKDIQAIIETIKYSIPSMLSVLSLLILFFFIYSILGVFLFHEVEEGDIIDEFTNFQNFIAAMISLLRVSTGEDWHLLMYDLEEANPITAYVYFTSFSIFTSLIMLNLFVMVFLQTLEDHYENPESYLDIFNRFDKQFKEVWSRYSSIHRGLKVHKSLLADILIDLGEPLGVDSSLKRFEITKVITTLNVPIDEEGYVYYHYLMFALIKRCKGKFRWNKKLEKLREKILLAEERRTIKKIKKANEELKQKNAIEKINYIHGKNQTSLNAFMDLVVMKKVFLSWKAWEVNRKEMRKLKEWKSSSDDREFRFEMNSSTLNFPKTRVFGTGNYSVR